MKTKFKYGDYVEVTDGFWSGYKGLVTDCNYTDLYPTGNFVVDSYEVLLELKLGKNDVRNVRLKEIWLKKVK